MCYCKQIFFFVCAVVLALASCGHSISEVVNPSNYVKCELYAVMQLSHNVTYCVHGERGLHRGHGATSSKALLQSTRQRLLTHVRSSSFAVGTHTHTHMDTGCMASCF